ncbi:hypothetical protein AXF42_Ash011271 [Apostasia shenzhenica]|uniref:Uncharacterized protein n=1 Tax=Apostasia shenzhenica TaxID=1088818 RepID=A0A2I0AE20_9ASPA|nr:hypothetical protein AXF42_Ash011271 [Apostasia shenzhenica]
MSAQAEGGDGPVVLKLTKLDLLPSHYKPSEFYEVSLSPARKLLLLLSYGSEALLLPVTFGKESFCYLKDEKDWTNHPDKCTFQAKHSVDFSQPSAENMESPCGVSSLSFDSCAAISNVKSFAWGHCGDTYSHYGQSDFQELLLVCTNNRLFVHAFRCSNKEYQVTKLIQESQPFHGSWVEWGPLHNIQAKDPISEVHGCENYFGDFQCSNSGLESKRWLRTFLTEMDVFLSGDKYLARFPAKSSYPHSAPVVSFDITSISLRFLESCPNVSPCDEKKQDTDVSAIVMGNELLSDSLQDNLANPTFGAKGKPYICLRVFSSYAYHFFGLVFTSAENASLESRGDEIKIGEKSFVVIVRLCLCGMEWLCSIDLQKPYSCSGSNSKWADFKFLESFLVCLTTSGLVCIWCAKTGDPIACFDILESCGFNAKIYSQPMHRKLSEVGGLICERTRTFKKLIVATFSLLLAVADEHGIIYLVDVNDFIPAYSHAPASEPSKITSRFQHSDLGILASWKVAGCGICFQKFSSDAFSTYFNVLEILGGDFGRTKNIDVLGPWQRKIFHITKGDLESHKSGFYTCSQKNSTKNCHSSDGSFSASMRRIFFPLHHHSNDTSVCLSPFGITRLVSYCDKFRGRTFKIIHSDLHVASTFLDDRNLDDHLLSKISSEKDVEESIGFSFEGFLYILTQKGLFVILPSVSITRGTMSVHSTRHWQPSTAACSKYEIKGLLVVNEHQELWRPWQMEIFDRTLIYEGAEEAETICLENGI